MRQHHGGKRTETLDYLHSMLAQLRVMAEAERCDMLAYLIEMAYLEAADLIKSTALHGSDRPGRKNPVSVARTKGP